MPNPAPGGPYSVQFSDPLDLFIVEGPGVVNGYGKSMKVQAMDAKDNLNIAYACGRASLTPAIEKAIEALEAFADSYSADGEFNTHTAEYSPKDLRRMARKTLSLLRAEKPST